jgi:acid phosphatase
MSDAQLEWLDLELSRSKARWKVVYGHHPIYSHGSHGDTDGLDKTLLPILQKNGAHAYIAGHEHTVQHLKPVGGVHLFVNAAGGQGARQAAPGPRTLYSASFYGFTVIDAGPDELRLRFVDTEAKTQYETAIQ